MTQRNSEISSSAEELHQQRVNDILGVISASNSEEWYDERTAIKNLQEGNPWFNQLASVPDPERISPHQLLQCHRKTYYKQLNAPEESEDADNETPPKQAPVSAHAGELVVI